VCVSGSWWSLGFRLLGDGFGVPLTEMDHTWVWVFWRSLS